MITKDQIRAARALLDWPQAELAERAGLSVDMISKLEKGLSKGSPSSLGRIETALNAAGIEFLPDDGVKRSTSTVATYHGRDGFVGFLEDVYQVMKACDAETYVSNVREEDFLKWEGDYARTHQRRMKEVGARYRIIVKESDPNLVASEYADYRAIPAEQFGEISFYLYGDKVAFISFEEEDVTVWVIQSEKMGRHFRQRFEESWIRAVPCIAAR